MEVTYSGIVGVVASAGVTLTAGGRQTHHARSVCVDYDGVANRVVSDIEIRGRFDGAPWRTVRDAVWDTGAMSTAIDESLARDIGLHQVDTALMETLDGVSETHVYIVEIRVANGMAIPAVKVHGRDLSRRNERVILGMDVISRGRLTVDSLHGATRMEFSMVKDS